MSAARFNARAVALNQGLVLIIGGFDGSNFPTAAELYDPVAGTFTWSGGSLNLPRYGATATLLNSGKVLVTGGSTCSLPGCPANAAEVYDPTANTFSHANGAMNVSRFNHSATLLTNGRS
jgi:Kelch motif